MIHCPFSMNRHHRSPPMLQDPVNRCTDLTHSRVDHENATRRHCSANGIKQLDASVNVVIVRGKHTSEDLGGCAAVASLWPHPPRHLSDCFEG